MAFIGKMLNIETLKNLNKMTYLIFREMRMSSSFLPSFLQGCSALIKWTIPSGIYVDPYQLQASVMNKTVRFSSHVSIEQMAHHAEPLTLHNLPSLKCSNSCSFSQLIPFHVRYHLPSNNDEYATVSLSSPTTYYSPTAYYSPTVSLLMLQTAISTALQ